MPFFGKGIGSDNSDTIGAVAQQSARLRLPTWKPRGSSFDGPKSWVIACYWFDSNGRLKMPVELNGRAALAHVRMDGVIPLRPLPIGFRPPTEDDFRVKEAAI